MLAVMLQQAAQIAIADESDKLPAFHDRCHAQTFARHLVDDFSHVRRGIHGWNRISSVHERRDAREALAQLAPRMQVGEVLFLESATLGERDGKRVAKSEHGGCRGRWRKSQRTGFVSDGAVESDLGGLRKG